MKSMPMAVLLAVMAAFVIAGCAKNDERCCERYHDDCGYRDLRDGCDCMHRHWRASRYGAFFDPDDFGRGRDSLYGSPRPRRDGDYSNFDDGDCRRCRCDRCPHEARSWRRYHEDAVSERYAPAMTPDMEYDE